ncbi:hypothetical protein HNQ91_005941 [Filimonas zeae]|nr:hypothetical protein [Filimonas zeae]MDR6342854.1 hypothetical protein [Filimonas zeae]
MKLLSGLVLVYILFFCSCKKEPGTTQFVSYEDTTWTVIGRTFIHPLDTAFTAAYTETLTTPVTGGDTLHFNRLADVFCPAGFCTTGNGGAVNGKVNVSLLYARTKGDFIRFARPTYSNTEGLLDNTAAFKITVSQNNKALTLTPGKMINIHFVSPAGLHNENRPLYGDTTIYNTGNFTWLGLSNQALLQPFTQTGNAGITFGYNLLTPKTGWMGCGREAENAGSAQTKLAVILPPICTNKTASVYAVLKNQRSVIRLNPEIISRAFISGKIPANTEVTLVVIAKTKMYYYLDSVSYTTAASGWQAIKIKPHRSTKEEINAFLDSL